MSRRLAIGALLLGFHIAIVTAPPSRADTVADFYKGRVVTLVIGVGDGGFYDTAGRVMAQHLRKYIPGNPVIVPQNMPGASQVAATEYAYNRAPRDGTSLLVVQPYVFLNKLLDPALRFDLQQFTWLGRVGPLEMVGLIGHQSKVQNVAEARQTQVIFGGNAPNGPASMIPWAMNRLAGTQIKVVRGYPSESAEVIAIERGEVEGIGNATLSDVAKRPDTLRVLYISGLERLASHPTIPTIVESVEQESDVPVMKLIAATPTVGLTLIAPPAVPEDRTAALRAAFDQMVRDADFIAELKRIDFETGPMSGAELGRFMKEEFSPSDDLIKRLGEAVAPQ